MAQISDESASKEILTPPAVPQIATVKPAIPEVVYSGKRESTSVIVKDRTGKTLDSSAYTVTTSPGRISMGGYSYSVKFIGDYSGGKILVLRSIPKAPRNIHPQPDLGALLQGGKSSR